MTRAHASEPARVSREARSDRAFLDAVRPVVEALGGELVGPRDAGPLVIPLEWQGEVVGAVRLPALHGALERLIERVADELGAPLAQLSREGKQRAVQLLDERGAFSFRKSVEDAAQALQVSRFTVYNYLARISGVRSPGEQGAAARAGSDDQTASQGGTKTPKQAGEPSDVARELPHDPA
jgi:hypothetical protein